MRNILLLTVIGCMSSISVFAQLTAKLLDSTDVSFHLTNKKKFDKAYAIKKGQLTLVQGNYDNGKRIGIWEAFNDDGTLFMKYNYDSNKLLALDQNAILQFDFTIQSSNEQEKTETRIPVPVCGIDLYKKLLVNELKGVLLTKQQIESNITAKFTALVDTKGGAKYVVDYTIDGVTNNVVLFVKNKTFDLKWIPATYNNKNLRSEVTFETKFHLKPNEYRRFIWTY